MRQVARQFQEKERKLHAELKRMHMHVKRKSERNRT